MESFLTKENADKEIFVWGKMLDDSSDEILNKIFPEKYLQNWFGEYMAEIIQYSKNPDLPDWIRGIAAQKVQIIMNVFENFVAMNLSDFEDAVVSRLRLKMVERVVDYLNLSIASWEEVTNWKFAILAGREPKIAFIREDEILRVKRR